MLILCLGGEWDELGTAGQVEATIDGYVTFGRLLSAYLATDANTVSGFFIGGHMTKTGFRYQVFALVEFSAAEIEYLMKLSQSHYDGLCKSVGRHGGFLYGWNNRLQIMGNSTKVEVSCSNDELQTLIKICEQESYACSYLPSLGNKQLSLNLYDPLYEILKQQMTISSTVNCTSC